MIRWLYPGIHIKRWLALMFLGLLIIGLGFGYVLREAYDTYSFPDIVYYLTLQFVPRYVRAALFAIVGVGAVVYGFYRLNRSLLEAMKPAGDDRSVLEMLQEYNRRKNGPRVVAIGGGTGLSTLLRGLKTHTANITAIVTVADDGGSSGRLRRELGVLPPGDFRNCIAALADAEPLMTSLFQYRFGQGSGLEGHSFGNLFIVAMSGVVGNFEQAIKESSRVLRVQGQILPSTLANLTLMAEMEDDATVEGESSITHAPGGIRRVFLEPGDAEAYPEAVQALLEADLIILGPGSLYTSIMPNLLVSGITDAVRSSRATRVYVCNVATQPGETDGYTIADHVAAIERHVGTGLFQFVLANERDDARFPEEWGVTPIQAGTLPGDGPKLVFADVVNEDNRLRHDPAKLAAALMRFQEEQRRRPREAQREMVATG